MQADQPPLGLPPLSQRIYKSLKNTQKQSDGVLLLLSPAISLCHILAEYLLEHHGNQLYLFVGLDDVEVAEVNRVANARRKEQLLRGEPISSSELVKLTPLKKEKRREAYAKGGFYTLTASIVVLDLLSGSELPAQLIRKIFLRDCEHVRSYKEQLGWINHLVRVEGDTPFSSNSITQTIVVSQRVERLTRSSFEDIYRIFGLKKVVMWPFGHEQVLRRIQSREFQFEEVEESVDLCPNDSAIMSCLEELMKYCGSCIEKEEKESGQPPRRANLYKLFREQSNESLAAESFKHPLATNLKQLRTLMFKLVNYAAIDTWRTLRLFETSRNPSAHFWDTSNQHAQARIEELKRRLRSSILEVRLSEEHRPVSLEYLRPEGESQEGALPASFVVTYSLVFHDPTTKKLAVLENLFQRIAEQGAARVWVVACSLKLTSYLLQEIHSYVSEQQKLHRLRSALAMLSDEREDRLAELRHLVALKKPTSRQVYAINCSVLLEEFFQELLLFFTLYDQFLSANLSNQEELATHPLLLEDLARLQERLRHHQFRYLAPEDLLRGVRNHPQRLHFNSATEMSIGGCLIAVGTSDTPEAVAEYIRLHDPTHVVMYSPSLMLLRCLYLQAQGVRQVYSINCRRSLEEAVYLSSATREDSAFWEIGKARTTLGEYLDDFKSRISEISEFNLVSRSMLRHGRSEVAAPLLKTLKKDFIVVDKRQYNSQLPAELYFAGFTTVPLMLETADYILSADRAVERKAIATYDIHESLRSGRLRDQLRRMSATFREPYLLIEGASSEEFSSKRLNSMWSYTSKEQYFLNVRQGVLELLKECPKIRLLWSHNPQETAQLFLWLKAGQIEPDIEQIRSKRSLEEDLSELAAASRTGTSLDE